jgi:hypothetical protein
MTSDYIRSKLTNIQHIHPAEKGCTVGELRELLTELADAIEERDAYRIKISGNTACAAHVESSAVLPVRKGADEQADGEISE